MVLTAFPASMSIGASTDRPALPPHTVDVVEHAWIPMPDGVRLAARLWIPREAWTAPAPAIFEYIPYRKADMVRARDERNHPFFAAHGYACIRVDMRGSGDSEGHMPDMYAENELSDARSVIEWLAAQPWCNGRVGMFGTSWGGTASLQAGVDAPEALAAVIAVCATHDRYEVDIHHKGGCLLTDTFEWGATLPAILALPPTRNVGEDWRERWEARLRSLAFPLEDWVREEARGDYWRRGSVIHEAERLSCPILAVGGWSDGYSSSVMSLVDARPDLVRGVVGPWGHHYPDQGHPGPAIQTGGSPDGGMGRRAGERTPLGHLARAPVFVDRDEARRLIARKSSVGQEEMEPCLESDYAGKFLPRVTDRSVGGSAYSCRFARSANFTRQIAKHGNSAQ